MPPEPSTTEDCGNCDGTGTVYPHDQDPIAYDEDDTAPCPDCQGSGRQPTDDDA
jgi:DnaJ-class molecular chaperone